MKINSVWPRKCELVTVFFIAISFTVNSECMLPRSKGSVLDRSVLPPQGTDVEQGEFPFLVALEIDHKLECVGALVTKSITLTICSCLMRDIWDPIIKIPHRLLEPSRVLVRAGTIDINDPAYSGWTERAEKLQVHPKCTRNSSLSFTQLDFGLVKVVKPFVLSPFRISVITLPDFGRIDVTNMLNGNTVPCVAMGWIVEPGFHMQRTWVTHLEKYDVTIQTPEWCQQLISNHTTSPQDEPFIFDRTFQICVLSSKANQSLCEMDGGAPLLCGEGPRKEFIAVITEGTEERHCGIEIPLVYARMDRADKWITGAIELSKSDKCTSSAYVTTIFVFMLSFGR